MKTVWRLPKNWTISEGKASFSAQLGTLAMLEGNLEEATERYRAALVLFRQLGRTRG